MYKIHIYVYIHTYSHNVKEKEAEFGQVSVTGEKKENKHMLVESDTSFCSNNLGNVWFIFKTKFCWRSLDAAVEILSLFLKGKEHLHDRVTPLQENRKSLYLCTEFVLQQDTGEFLVSTLCLLCMFLPSLTQICSGIRTSKGATIILPPVMYMAV